MRWANAAREFLMLNLLGMGHFGADNRSDSDVTARLPIASVLLGNFGEMPRVVRDRALHGAVWAIEWSGCSAFDGAEYDIGFGHHWRLGRL
jgi:hypothetical protein